MNLFPAVFKELENGTIEITFGSFPEFTAIAKTKEACYGIAVSNLKSLIITKMKNGEYIPQPFVRMYYENYISLDAMFSIKVCIHNALLERKITVEDFAITIGYDAASVKNWLDPIATSNPDMLQLMFAALGYVFCINPQKSKREEIVGVNEMPVDYLNSN